MTRRNLMFFFYETFEIICKNVTYQNSFLTNKIPVLISHGAFSSDKKTRTAPL